ncbi:alpha/beta fold hydrolase [Actinomadura oligospora]|uniref:alpha/beta fold hydrolase n=1 Tax=Actinomadura oligospora TaxID=111804 RepID=UPI0004798F22|nr:alpha/beta fold hydrolase [Actinomadura oligospora]
MTGGHRDLRVPVAPGVRLRVRHRPGDRRPAFLLLHGLASNALLWDEVAGLLAAEGLPSYAVDLRGHGESDGPEDGYDTATAVADVAAVVAALDLAPAVVAGHSWGGGVALRLAAEHPDLVAGLALVDGGWVDIAARMPERMGRWREVASQRIAGRGGDTPEETRAQLRKAHPGWSETAVEAHLADLRPGPDGLLVPRLPDPHFMSILECVWNERPHRWYPRVSAPVMLMPAVHEGSVAGSRLTREWVDGAASALSRATVRWYMGSDHHLHSENPERVAKDLLDLAREAAP